MAKSAPVTFTVRSLAGNTTGRPLPLGGGQQVLPGKTGTGISEVSRLAGSGGDARPA